MRRSALQALCRLALRPAAGPPQATLPAAAASILVDECSSLTTAALHTAGSSSPPPLPPAAAVAARAPARPFSSAAAAGSPHVDQPVSEATHSEFQQQQYLHQQEPRRQQRRWQSREAPDPASPLGRLAACGSAQDLRAWQQELVAQGSFGPEELAAAIRLLFIPEQRGGLALQGADREAALRELVDAACSNPDATLDGRAAAYCLWGLAKAQRPADDGDVQRVLPLAFQRLESMEGHDASSLVWALGIMAVPLTPEQQEALLGRLRPLLPEMKWKELTAALGGVTRLRLPAAFAQPFVEALDRKAEEGQEHLGVHELGLMLKIAPRLKGLSADGPFVAMLFGQLLRQASKCSLTALAEGVSAAADMGCTFDDDAVQRLVSAAQYRLSENRGPQVQQLLRGLSVLGYESSPEGPVSEDFVERCVREQVAALCPGGVPRARQDKRAPALMSQLLFTLSALKAWVPEEHLAALLAGLEACGLDQLRKPAMTQMAFRRLRFQPGVDALEPLTRYSERAPRQGSRQRRQQQQEEEQEEATAQQPSEAQQDEPSAATAASAST